MGPPSRSGPCPLRAARRQPSGGSVRSPHASRTIDAVLATSVLGLRSAPRAVSTPWTQARHTTAPSPSCLRSRPSLCAARDRSARTAPQPSLLAPSHRPPNRRRSRPRHGPASSRAPVITRHQMRRLRSQCAATMQLSDGQLPCGAWSAPPRAAAQQIRAAGGLSGRTGYLRGSSDTLRPLPI